MVKRKSRLKSIQKVSSKARLYPIISDINVITTLNEQEFTWGDVREVKKLSQLTDEIIGNLLDITPRSIRKYKFSEAKLKPRLKEKVFLLSNLFKHGINVFGSTKAFNEWINQENFFLDGKSPITFLNTVTGIRFIDDRLTAMEFGDNV